MKTSIKLSGLVAAMLMAAAGSSFAADPVVPYVQSSANQTVVNSTGLCWRTGFWTPALAEQAGPEGAGCSCDKDILSAAACTKAEPAAPAEEPKVAKVMLAADTLFGFDSTKLSASGTDMLDQLVSRMAGMDVEVILTTGYADRLGKEAYNQQLSERRAEAVKAYLVNKGVDSGLVQTEGRGTADPVVDCPKPTRNGQIKNVQDLVKCLAPNRRAVIEVIGTRSVQ